MKDRFKFIKDTELKFIGKSKKQRYMFALFECPYCHNLMSMRVNFVSKIYSDWLKIGLTMEQMNYDR